MNYSEIPDSWKGNFIKTYKENDMASMRQAAQDVLDIGRDGIGWIALWKDGKGWMSRGFWPDIDDKGRLSFEDYDKGALKRIRDLDPLAILVNSWEHNLGDTTCMTRDTLANALRWQYDLQHYLVEDALLWNNVEGVRA